MQILYDIIMIYTTIIIYALRDNCCCGRRRYIDKCKSHRRNNVYQVQDKKPINGRRGAADLRSFFFFLVIHKKDGCADFRSRPFNVAQIR